MKTAKLFSAIMLTAAAVSGCERRDADVRDEPTTQEQRADRQAFSTKARERLRQLDARIGQLEKNTEARLRQLTQQAKVTADDDDKKDIQDREKKLRDKWSDDLADLKKEREELKADIDSLEMKAEANWDEAKRDTNEAFDDLEEDVDKLGKDIEEASTKTVDKAREELREERRDLDRDLERRRDVEERDTHD